MGSLTAEKGGKKVSAEEHSFPADQSLDVRWVPCPYHALKVLYALDPVPPGKVLRVILEKGQPLSIIEGIAG